MTEKRMSYEQIKVDDLKPSEYNPRSMSKFDMENLKKSLKEYGFVEPIVINKDNTVIGGHQRLQAAIYLGMEEVPCFRVDISKTREKALNLSLNKIHGDWDTDLLASVMKELSLEESFDELLTGFASTEIDIMLGNFENANDWENEYDGMPEYNNEDQTSFKKIVVHFANEEDMNAFSELVKQSLTIDTRFIWYPEIEIETYGSCTGEAVEDGEPRNES